MALSSALMARPLSSLAVSICFPQLGQLKEGSDTTSIAGSTGIGYYIAAAFMQAGAKQVIITSRKEDGLSEAVNKLNTIPDLPGRASYIVSNISTISGVEKLTEDLRNALPDGKLHILVNNAAASWGGPFEEYDDWKVAKTFDVNVRAVFNLTRKLVIRKASGCCADVKPGYNHFSWQLAQNKIQQGTSLSAQSVV